MIFSDICGNKNALEEGILLVAGIVRQNSYGELPVLKETAVKIESRCYMTSVKISVNSASREGILLVAGIVRQNSYGA